MKFGENIYIAQFDKQNSMSGIDVYKKPISFTLRPNYLSVQPASGYTSVMVYGKDITKVWHCTAILDRFRNVFNENDLLYLDGANPQGEAEYGENANAIIDSVSYQNRSIRIVAKKRVLND